VHDQRGDLARVVVLGGTSGARDGFGPGIAASRDTGARARCARRPRGQTVAKRAVIAQTGAGSSADHHGESRGGRAAPQALDEVAAPHREVESISDEEGASSLTEGLRQQQKHGRGQIRSVESAGRAEGLRGRSEGQGMGAESLSERYSDGKIESTRSRSPRSGSWITLPSCLSTRSRALLPSAQSRASPCRSS
jgi:hypothetical protein